MSAKNTPDERPHKPYRSVRTGPKPEDDDRTRANVIAALERSLELFRTCPDEPRGPGAPYDDDGQALVEMCHAYLARAGQRRMSLGGLNIEMRPTHLAGPTSCAKAIRGDESTTSLGHVDCPACLESRRYGEIRAVLSRYSL